MTASWYSYSSHITIITDKHQYISNKSTSHCQVYVQLAIKLCVFKTFYVLELHKIFMLLCAYMSYLCNLLTFICVLLTVIALEALCLCTI